MTEPTNDTETLNPRQLAESYARAIDVLMKYAYDSGHYERPNRLVMVLEQLFADGQARGRAEALAAVKTWTLDTPASYAQGSELEKLQYQLWIEVKRHVAGTGQ